MRDDGRHRLGRRPPHFPAGVLVVAPLLLAGPAGKGGWVGLCWHMLGATYGMPAAGEASRQTWQRSAEPGNRQARGASQLGPPSQGGQLVGWLASRRTHCLGSLLMHCAGHAASQEGACMGFAAGLAGSLLILFHVLGLLLFLHIISIVGVKAAGQGDQSFDFSGSRDPGRGPADG